ncbi:hypothetical protein PC112_g9842 [Phytophthora cactorum]|nr:hypothetical protein PC112_g9842 [Phytophthora cactorum]
MNEIPRCQKRKSDDQSPSDGRRPHHCVQSDEPTAETASSLGGAALFKDVWGTLVKAGWTSKRSSSRSLDSRYKYIRPGGRHDGEEGTNFLLGELAVLTYVKDICIIDSTVQGVYDQEGATVLYGSSVDVDGVSVALPVRQPPPSVAVKGSVKGSTTREQKALSPLVYATERLKTSAPASVALPVRQTLLGVEYEIEMVVGRTRKRNQATCGSRAGAHGSEAEVEVLVEQLAVGADGDNPERSTAFSGHASTVTIHESALHSGAAPIATTELRRHLHDVYVRKLVAFSPDKERWMKSKAYRPIGTAYINGRAYRLAQKGKNASLFQIRWLDSHFQSAVEHISVAIVQQGIKDNVSLTRVKNPDWRILVRPDPTDEIDCDGGSSDCGEEEVLEAFDPRQVDAPSNLYQHADGSTKTYLRPEFNH